MPERIFQNPTYPEVTKYQEPSISIPSNRDLDTTERGQLVARYRDEFVSLNPGVTAWELDAAAARFKSKVLQSGSAIKAFDEDMALKQAARDKAAQEEAARQEAAIQAQRDAENAELKAAHRRTWVDNGGTPEDFERRWPEIRLRVLEEATLQQRNAALAKTTPTWRG